MHTYFKTSSYYESSYSYFLIDSYAIFMYCLAWNAWIQEIVGAILETGHEGLAVAVALHSLEWRFFSSLVKSTRHKL